MIIKCPHCGVYVEPFLAVDQGDWENIILVCPACGSKLSSKDIGGEEDDYNQ